MKSSVIINTSSVVVTLFASCGTTILGLLVVTINGNYRVKEYRDILQSVIDTLSVLGLPAAVGLVMLSKEVILIIAGKKYLDGSFSLQIITWAMVFSNFSMIFNQCVLIPTKREGKSLRNTLITGIVNVGLNFILIPLWSFDGAALTTVIAEFMIMTLNGWSARDYVGPILRSSQTRKNLANSIFGCLGIVLVYWLLKLGIPSLILRTILSVILSVGIYGAILVLCGNKIVMDYLGKIRKRI